MNSTRDLILHTLLTQPRCSIIELANEVGINPISVRHHIATLQAEGLIASEEEHHGVGRPRRVYFLTEAGAEKFPTRYIKLTLRLLSQLKETMPEPMIHKLFSQIATDIVDEVANSKDFHDTRIEEKLNMMKQWLVREGFHMEWKKQGDQYYIYESSCPYYHVGQDHPEVCSVDQILISSLLDLPVSKIQCILNGDNSCTYVVNTPTSQEPS